MLSQLNQAQREAVEAPAGPLLILAGAGSGKTKMLTHRIARFIENGIPPDNILAVTFTNKAAREMKERTSKLIGRGVSVDAMAIGTFHGIFARLLRQHGHYLGFKANFSIYDESDQERLMKQVIQGLGYGEQRINPKAVLSVISRAKNDQKSAQKFLEGEDGFFPEVVRQAHPRYQKLLFDHQAMDFDDLLCLSTELLKKYENVLDQTRNRWKHIFVDEYQDVNQVQYSLIRLLSQKHQSLSVVGDDWQAIYGWRGADPDYILNFTRDFPHSRVITLEQNYRSTQPILDFSHEIIKQNSEQKHKQLWTEKKKGIKPELITTSSSEDESFFIADTLENMHHKHGTPFTEMAVLYRTHAQSRQIEQAMLEKGVPYTIVGGIRFYNRQEIKDVIAYLKYLANPQDKLSLKRLANTPTRGIGPKTFAEVIKALSVNNKVSKKNVKVTKLLSLLKQLRKIQRELPLSSFLRLLLEKINMRNHLLNGTEEGEMRWENVMELISVAKRYDDIPPKQALESFLEETALDSPADHIQEKAGSVSLMTAHLAKGLEFSIVIMAGMEDGLFPHNRSLLNPAELEEECRLCYVGTTRAKEQLIITHTNERTLFGTSRYLPLSRFISDISASLYTTGSPSAALKPTVSIKTIKRYKEGEEVQHPNFGRGTIVGQHDDIVHIIFKNHGLKRLASSVAPLNRVVKR